MNVDLIALVQDIPWLGPYLPDILTAIGIVAVVAAQLPVPAKATGWYVAVWRVLHWVAQNYRYAKPAAQPPGKDADPPATPKGSSTAAVAMLVLLAAGMLSACANRTSVAMAQVALTAAEQAATAYVTRPPCPAVTLCSDADVVARIKAADNVAYAAVQAAATGATTPDAAMAAVAGLIALIPDLSK